jgi:hypothetical protein
MYEPPQSLISNHFLKTEWLIDIINQPLIIKESHEDALWKTTSFSEGYFYVSIYFSTFRAFANFSVCCDQVINILNMYEDWERKNAPDLFEKVYVIYGLVC